jgi:hypothetical protein
MRVLTNSAQCPLRSESDPIAALPQSDAMGQKGTYVPQQTVPIIAISRSKQGGQRASGASAWRSGSLDICNSPAKGRSISRIRKIAPDTESAPTKNVTITIGLS